MYYYDIISDHPLIRELTDKTTGYTDGFIRIQPSGFILPYHTNYLEKIKTFEERPNDIWVSSFPKSGTTWALEMVWCLMSDLNFAILKGLDL